MNYLSRIGIVHYLLNKQYPIYIRFFISLGYCLICITTTVNVKLSFLFFKRVLLKNDLKSESRRLVWIIKRKFFIILEKTDIMFDFCSGLNLKEISILNQKNLNNKEYYIKEILFKLEPYEQLDDKYRLIISNIKD